MVLMIPEEGSFSLRAYVTSPGYQTIIPKGFLVYRDREVWIAPLIPQLFYGVTGEQLGPSWRQYFSETGEQVVLSRVAGKPEVPREQLYWRKISEEKVHEYGMAEEIGFWQEWHDWLSENWSWFLPMTAIVVGPILGSSVMIIWDYMKLKGLVK